MNENVGAALGLTLIAGLSTGIGSAIAYFIKKPKIVYLAFALGLSGGVMIYISFMEMLPGAMETMGEKWAVLVFFISYLSAVGKTEKNIFIAGIAYVFAVFMSYLLLGIGLLTFLQESSFQYYIQVPVAIFAILVGLLSFRDAIIAKKRGAKEMKMVMPKKFREIYQKVIRKTLETKYVLLASFFLGLLVSMFELPCTGQVYIIILSIMLETGSVP